MNDMQQTIKSLGIDPITLFVSIFSVFLTASFILWDVDLAKQLIGQTYSLIVDNFGSAYLVLTIFSFIFLILISISKYGNYVLGGKGTYPEFSYFSWIGMLFCSGIGGGIIYWSGVEWAYYVEIPQFNIEPYSDESYSLATAYGLFHWGISAWSIYGIPAIALSIAFYKYNLNSLRLSSSLKGLGFKNIESSLFGRFIDLTFILATVGAAGGTIGSYIPMLSSGFTNLFNINNGLQIDIGVIILCVSLFGFSVYKGLDKGIKNLSNFNLILALVFIFLVITSSDFFSLIKTSYSGIKFSFIYFWEMSTLGISEPSDFAKEWTIFYWAWWVAFGPLVGLFIARISKGRSIRQVIAGMLIFGTLGTWLFYLVLGGYSMNGELNNELNIIQNMKDIGHAETAISVINSLPMSGLMLLVFCVITIVFITTSYDSMSYVISSHVLKTEGANKEPHKNLRLSWAIILGILPAVLVLYSDHSVALDLILITSLPLLFIYPLMAISVVRELSRDK
ncbi:MAG: BCCT family transporter [Gammaproteobacteria bacterium]